MPNSYETIPLPVIKRLPRYYRYVEGLHQHGIATISSSELAALLGTTASQVRQDFNCFGGFGQQGVGYSVSHLYKSLSNLLFSDTPIDAILIGVGRLGRTIAHFITHEVKGFSLIAAFDTSEKIIGRSVSDVPVYDVSTLQNFCKEHSPQVAVLCVPQEGASKLAPSLFAYGIKGFWNFSHYDLASASKDIVVENVHLGDSISSLGFRVRNL